MNPGSRPDTISISRCANAGINSTIAKFLLETSGNALKPGDVDGDNDVDQFDYNIIRDHLFLNVASRNLGDLTSDGIVDFLDFRQWKTAHEAGSGALSGLTIPEPSVGCLIGLGLGCLMMRRTGLGCRSSKMSNWRQSSV